MELFASSHVEQLLTTAERVRQHVGIHHRRCSLVGAILGAIYLEGLPALFGANQTIQFITSGLGLILFILYLPGGLAEVLHRTGDAVTLGIRSAQERLGSRHTGPPATPALVAEGVES